MYSISEASKLLGISTHTLRYYEKEKIIVSDRKGNGDRLYTETQISWLGFVMKLRQTQMPLAKIREYAELASGGDKTALERLKLLEDHRREIQKQQADLAATEEMLDKKILGYQEFISSLSAEVK